MMGVREWRRVVLLVALAAAAPKLWLAATTFGSNDVHAWIDFTQGAREHGLFDLYGHEYYTQYNHPPLTGVWLVAVNWLADAGVADVPFLIRVPAIVADVVTALLVFELVRIGRSIVDAGIASVLVSLSPALIVISGFHGNTDAVFVMFALLSAHLVARERPLAAGVAIALAISVKLVPIVIVPVLVAHLLRSGHRNLVRFAVGGAAVFVPLWGPVLILSWSEFRENVLAYRGSLYLFRWGLPQFLSWGHAPDEWSTTFAASGGVVLLVCAVLPAALVWRRPNAFIPAVGLSLSLLLVLTPAFGMQYLCWPLSAAYLVGTVPATAYNLAASMLVLRVYGYWSGGGPPWSWYEAKANVLRFSDLKVMVAAWIALVWVAVEGTRRVTRPEIVGGAVGPSTGPDPRA